MFGQGCRPKMSGAAIYEQRGGLLRVASSNSFNNAAAGGETQFKHTSSSATSITEHDYRFPRRPDQNIGQGASSSSSSIAFPPPLSTTHTSPTDSSASALNKLDLSAGSSARKELLRESFFPTWRDDAAGDELDSPDEMQKKDPLATQIWRLYSKTKKQLPNQERMENLTWRMMAMSLRKRKQQEEAARYGSCD